MAKRKNQKQIGITDTLAMCGLYALLLILFIVPGIIIEGQPISALDLMRAAKSYQFGGFPGTLAIAREMLALPVLCAIGIVITLLMRRSSGKYAFGACISALLFGMIAVFQARHLPQAGGFVIGTAIFVSLVLFLVSIICAIIRKQ